MAYGITVDGSGGIFGIDSNTSTTKHLAIKVAPKNITANTTITDWDRSKGDLIFARPQSTATGTNETNNYLGLKLSSGNYSFNVDANYMVIQTAEEAIANDDNGSSFVNGSLYGIQINNAAATPITILDSRRFNTGLEFLKIYDPEYFVGGDANFTSDNLVYQASSTSTLQEIYVCVNTSQYSVNQGHFNMYYYHFSDYAIYFHSYIQGAAGFVFSSAIKNSTAVIVGAHKS